jgi:hypothetical protein
MSFEAELVFNIECQQGATRNADRKAEHINKGENLVLQQVSESDGNVVFEHMGGVVATCFPISVPLEKRRI